MKALKVVSPLMQPTTGLRILDVLGVFWLFVLTDAYIQGRELPALLAETDLPELPLISAALIIVIGSVITAGLTFWQRQNIMQTMPVVHNALDHVFGEGAYHYLIHKLRPVLMSILSSLVLAAVGFYTNYQGADDDWSNAIFSGLVFFSMTMLSVLVISRSFPPILK